MNKSPYISRVIIKNFRNFKDLDINLDHKQIIVGENGVGKTNYIYALRLILDPTLSDQDRLLEETDFNSSIEYPYKNKEEIYIAIEIDNYMDNIGILSQISSGATVIDYKGKEKLRFNYKFRPSKKSKDIYEYIIYKGDDEKNLFTYKDREILNIKVISALRDVERELKSNSKSPINKMLKKYNIDFRSLEDIVNQMHVKSQELLRIYELVDITRKINKTYKDILGQNNKNELQLDTMELEPSRILYSMKLLNNTRNITENSLGINNIIYISLILSYLKDETIPTLIKKDDMERLKEEENADILNNTYIYTKNNNYILKDNIEQEEYSCLYRFMSLNKKDIDSFTIIVIEEPEAHLHLINQRLVYRDVINNSYSSVILTTHSTNITSIAPLNYIVTLRQNVSGITKSKSLYNIKLSEAEKKDLERYIDIKKSELYFGKGIIFVEGIAEEYLIPRFSDLLGYPLDEHGIVICNINSTNFKPFINLCINLDIPYVVITDGDFYYIKKNGEREYHKIYDKKDTRKYGYLGFERLGAQLYDLDLINKDEANMELHYKELVFKSIGIFISNYTFEIEIMRACKNDRKSCEILSNIYNALNNNSKTKTARFIKSIYSEKYDCCLKRIEENGIGKGRYAQMLSTMCTRRHVPQYIEESIEYIVHEVMKNYELL